MIHFFGLTYWQRMWIVQEIGLAKNLTLILGSVSARWESLHVLLQLIDGFSHWRLSSNRKDILASQAARLDFHRSEIRRNTLESLIESCEKCICSDPKDKVYSLVGLADDCQDNELLVDYSKSLFDVYSDVLDFYIRSRDCEDRPSRHLVRFSHILQKSFDRYSEICEGAQTYLYSLEVRVPTPFVQVLGIETNQVLELGPILDSTCLLNLMRESPEDFPHCKTTVSNVVRNIEKLVSFMGSASYAVGRMSPRGLLCAVNSKQANKSFQRLSLYLPRWRNRQQLRSSHQYMSAPVTLRRPGAELSTYEMVKSDTVRSISCQEMSSANFHDVTW
ncbi:hypothetical protein DL98DRAFT_277797 [Cadophora sp. DSE1049]|nr:hypothetical protein DL98DRAFT_277797 [Cadophora sp. DSE1049]